MFKLLKKEARVQELREVKAVLLSFDVLLPLE